MMHVARLIRKATCSKDIRRLGEKAEAAGIGIIWAVSTGDNRWQASTARNPLAWPIAIVKRPSDVPAVTAALCWNWSMENGPHLTKDYETARSGEKVIARGGAEVIFAVPSSVLEQIMGSAVR